MATSEALLGARERVILASEGTYGSAAVLTSAYMPGYDVVVNPMFTQGFQEIKGAGTDARTINSRIAGPLALPYTMQFVPANWRMLKYVFDIDSETGSDPYTHTLSIGNTLASFTSEWAVQHDSDPQIFKLTGNVINQFRINWRKATGEGSEGHIVCTANCFAQNYTTPSLQAGTFTISGDPFQYRHSTITLQSSAVVEINSGELVFDQGMNLNDFRYGSSASGRTIGTPFPGVFRISGRLNLNLLGTTYTSIWEAATALTGTNTIVFQQSASNKVTFTLTNMYVDPVPVAGTNLDGVNTGDFVFTATSVATVVIDSIENF